MSNPLAFGREVGFFALGGGELELLGEVFPDVVVLAPEPARDAVASLVSTRGRQEQGDGCPQYGPNCDSRRKQTDIVPVGNGFVRQSIWFWLWDGTLRRGLGDRGRRPGRAGRIEHEKA